MGQDIWHKGYLIWHRNADPEIGYFSVGTYDADNPLILQESGGNVGLGTLDPNAKLEVQYFTNNYNLFGYNMATLNYIKHSELESEGDGQSALYAVRTLADVSNHGTGYGHDGTNVALKGYNVWGDLYTFGMAGYNYNDDTRCGGILGSDYYGYYWGSLGYKDSGGNTYGGYFTSSSLGSGKGGQNKCSGIGIGVRGDLLGADIHGKLYGTYTEGDNYALFSNGTVYNNGLEVNLQENGTETKTILYTNTSTDVTVQTSGIVTLTNGKASITFDDAFIRSISPVVPVVVVAMPAGKTNGIYLEEVSHQGFTVAEVNDGTGQVIINYIAIGRRTGYENPQISKEIVNADFTSKMQRGLHNDDEINTRGEGLYFDKGELVVGVPPAEIDRPEVTLQLNKEQSTIKKFGEEKVDKALIGQ
jgi:hypothetical protein